jgi:F-type H+-transporting ATPase subunit epsilon
MMPDSLHLEVVTPERRVVEATTPEVQLPGSDGFFGILPGHAPLLTELGIGELSYHDGGTVRYCAVFGGYAEVLPDRVTALAEAAERPEEINVDRARAAKQAAEKKLATQGISLEEADEARTALMCADLRIQVAARAGRVSADGVKAAHA